MVEDKKWRIWFEAYDECGNCTGGGAHTREYTHFGNAENAAKRLYGDKSRYKYVVAIRNPWQSYTQPAVCTICGREYDVVESNEGFPLYNHVDIRLRDHPQINERTSCFRYKDKILEHHHPCPDCVEKVLSFVQTLKASDT